MTTKSHPGGPIAASSMPDPVMPRGIQESPGIPASAPAGSGQVTHLPLDRVRPLPGFNPRTAFDQAYLGELAESIREHGVLQPITVRPITHGLVFGEDAADFYAIVMGECRYRASRLAGMTTVRAIVEEMTETQHRQRAIIENIQRQPLNPIDEARGYKSLRDLGMTVSEIAVKVGRGQPAVSKSLALLDLPLSAQAKVGDGVLSVSQALVIRRYDEHPEVVETLTQIVARDGIASHTLEKGLPSAVTSSLVNQKKAVGFGYHDGFQKTVCAKACPFKAYVKSEYGTFYCLRPAHYRELAKEESRAQAEKNRQVAERAQGAGPAPRLSDMSSESYEIVRPHSCPAGCTEACACRGQGIGGPGSTDTLTTICVDPKRFRALRKAEEKKRDDEKLDTARDIEKRVAAALSTLNGPAETFDGEARQEELLRRCAAVALRDAFSNATVEDIKIASIGLGLGLGLDLDSYSPYASGSFGGFERSLAMLDVTTQIRLATAVRMRRAVHAIKQGYGSTKIPEWLLSQESLPPAWAEPEQPQAPQPETASPKSDAPVDAAATDPVCTRCDHSFTPDAENGWEILPNAVRMTEEGCLHTPQGLFYCADCSCTVTTCRECGCTDEAGCDLGGGESCCWTEPDLCSACATKDESPEMLALEVAA